MLNNELKKNFEWIYLYGQEKSKKFDADNFRRFADKPRNSQKINTHKN